jgi:hypothetical protein
VGYVIALALVMLLVFGGYYLFKSGTVTPEKIARRFGVRVPQQAEEEAAELPPVQVAPGACPFCGTAKDPVTGACACTLEAQERAGASSAAGQHRGAEAPAISGPATGPRLIVLAGAETGRAFGVKQEGTVVGRDASCDVPLPGDTTVSRRHAFLAASDGAYTIRDEGSSNGTFVNGHKVDEAPLNPGDEVIVGQTRLRFEI